MASYTLGPVWCAGVNPNTTSQSTQGHEFAGRVIIDETANVAANTSSITWRFEVYILRTAYASNYTATSNNFVQVTINGSTVFSTSNVGTVNIHGDGAGNGNYSSNPVILASGSLTIEHDSDGSKTLNVSAIYTKNLAYLQSITVSGAVTLTKIARTAPIDSITDITLGSSNVSPTIKWTSPNTAYYYKVSYACGNNVVTSGMLHPTSTSQYTYSSLGIPASFAGGITTATSGTATATLETYSSNSTSALIGYTTKTFTINVPNNSTFQPTATISALTAVNAFNTSTYLANRTTFNYTLSGSAVYGATIKSYKFVVTDSKSKEVYSYTGTTTTGTVPAITVSGTATFTLTVTDSRGLTKTASTTRSITAYKNPSITATATRGTSQSGVSGQTCSDFVVDEGSGAIVRISYTVTYSSISGNSTTVSVQKPGSTSWTTLSANPAYFPGYSSETSYEFTVRVYDTVGGSSNAATAKVQVSAAAYPMDFMPAGNGVAFGMVAKKTNTMQVAWNLEMMQGKAIDFYNANGTKTGGVANNEWGVGMETKSVSGVSWSIIKIGSLRICRASVNKTVNINNAWGAVYSGTTNQTDANFPSVTYPVTFSAVPTCFVTYAANGQYDAWASTAVDYSPSTDADKKTRSPAYDLTRPTSMNSVKGTMHYLVIGTV